MPCDTLATASPGRLAEAVTAAIRAVPPAWPLAATVAVNPFLGQAGEDLASCSARLARVGGLRCTMPRRWYAERVATGEIATTDLAAALAACPWPDRPADLEALRAALAEEPAPPRALPTLAALAAEATATDWPTILADRIGAFCAAWFDDGQALWPMARDDGLYAAWRAQASRDLTPELHGLVGFCAHVARAPQTEERAIARAMAALGVGDAAAPTVLHRLLMDLGGWAQLARRSLFEAERDGGADRTLLGLLAVRCIWEEALQSAFGDRLAASWAATLAAHAEPLVPTRDDIIQAILQEAA